MMIAYNKFCESCPVQFCYIKDTNTMFGRTANKELLETPRYALRVTCKLQEYQYVIYNNSGEYQKHINFKDLISTIDALLTEPILTLEDTLGLLKFKRNL